MNPLVDVIVFVKGAILVVFILFAIAVISTLSPRGWALEPGKKHRRREFRRKRNVPPGETAVRDSASGPAGPGSMARKDRPADTQPHDAPAASEIAETLTMWVNGALLVCVAAILMPVILVSFFAAFSSFGTAALLLVIGLMFVLEFAPLGSASKWVLIALPMVAAAVWALSTGKVVPALALLVSASALTGVLAFWTRSKVGFVRRRGKKRAFTEKTIKVLGEPDPGFGPGGEDRIMKHSKAARGPTIYFRQPE